MASGHGNRLRLKRRRVSWLVRYLFALNRYQSF